MKIRMKWPELPLEYDRVPVNYTGEKLHTIFHFCFLFNFVLAASMAEKYLNIGLSFYISYLPVIIIPEISQIAAFNENPKESLLVLLVFSLSFYNVIIGIIYRYYNPLIGMIYKPLKWTFRFFWELFEFAITISVFFTLYFWPYPWYWLSSVAFKSVYTMFYCFSLILCLNVIIATSVVRLFFHLKGCLDQRKHKGE